MTADLPFSRPLPLRTDVPSTAIRLVADADTRAAVAVFLDLPAIERFAFEGVVETDGGDFVLAGRVQARVIQECVVTFDPVPADLDLAVRRRFRIGAAPQAELRIDPLAEDVDHLPAPVADMGAIAVEELALALDPYPRAPHADAALARVEEPGAAPFAALAQRRLDA